MSRTSIFLISAATVLAGACRDNPMASGPGAVELRADPPALALEAGETATLAVTATDWEGRPLPPGRVRFWSDRPAVASVDSLTGVVTAVAPGAAEVVVHARPLRVVVPVTVQLRGGLAVSGFALEPESARGVELDTWSLSTRYLRFRIRNAAGESLCGAVALTLESDTALFTARYAPPIGMPCAITLLPRAAGAGWLKVRAGGAADSVRVTVRRTRFRWAFGGPPSIPHTVGTPVVHELFVIGDDGRDVAGLPVKFFWEKVGEWGYDTVPIGADGFARVHRTLPLHPLRRTSETWNYGYFQDTVYEFRIHATARLPDGTVLEDGSVLELRPDAPHHIEVLALRGRHDEFSGSFSWSNRRELRYRTLTGDSVALRRFVHRRTAATTVRIVDTVAAIVADRYGNPTGVVPVLLAVEGGAARVTAERAYTETDSYYEDAIGPSGYGSVGITESVGGRVVITDLVAPFPRVRLTFGAPGLAPRTITVVGVDSFP